MVHLTKFFFCTFMCVTGLGRVELTCENSVDYKKKRDEAKSIMLHLFL